MSGLGTLPGDEPPDWLVTWATAGVLAGAVARFVQTGEPQWAAFALVAAGVVAVPPLVARDPKVAFPAELVVLVAVPVVLRAAGWFPQATPFFVAGGLALLAAVALEAYTSLELTPRFAVVLTVITTMAFAGIWTVGLWVTDLAVGTRFVTGKTELMWDLATASAMGLVTGAIAEGYVRYTDRLSGLTGPTATRCEPSRDVTPTDRDDDTRQELAVRGMQAVLGLVTAVALVDGNWKLAVNSATPLAVTFLPAVLRREYGYAMDTWLVFWLTLAATLHAVGALGLYRTVGWYDSVAHTVSASLVAVVGYALARAAELHTRQVSFDPAFRSVFVLLFVLAAGVGWELLEFASGVLAAFTGKPVLVQYGVADIATDLIFDAVGGLAVAFLSSERFANVARFATEFVGALVTRE